MIIYSPALFFDADYIINIISLTFFYVRRAGQPFAAMPDIDFCRR